MRWTDGKEEERGINYIRFMPFAVKHVSDARGMRFSTCGPARGDWGLGRANDIIDIIGKFESPKLIIGNLGNVRLRLIDTLYERKGSLSSLSMKTRSKRGINYAPLDDYTQCRIGCRRVLTERLHRM